jgi:hypothetical protein
MTSTSQNDDRLMRYGHPIYEVNPSLQSSLAIQSQQQQSVTGTDDNLPIDDSQEMLKSGHLADRVERYHQFIQDPGAALTDLLASQELDSEQFVKFYLDGIRQYARLNQPGINLLEFVCQQVSSKNSYNKDTICLNYALANKWKPDLNRRTYSRGLADLLDKEFLFRSMLNDIYFINVRFVFNGDRVVLVKSYQSSITNY